MAGVPTTGKHRAGSLDGVSSGLGSHAQGDPAAACQLATLIAPLFPQEVPCEPNPEAIVGWIARAVEAGFTRVFAINTEGCAGPNCTEAVVGELARRGLIADVAEQVRGIMLSAEGGNAFHRGPLAPILTNVLYSRLDEILTQVAATGREGGTTHAKCVRMGHEVVVLFDLHPRFAWLFDAAKHRVREELSRIGCDPQAAVTQDADLSRGGKLSLPGYELVVVWKRNKLVVRSRSQAADAKLWQTATDCHQGTARPARGQRLNGSGFRLVQAVGGRLLTYLPRFEWVRHAFHRWTTASCWSRVRHMVAQAPERGRRNPAAAVAITSACAAVGCFLTLGCDVYGNLSGEAAVPGRPDGFAIGQFNRDAPWGREIVRYGLYVPPHFKGTDGPFPLIVFLHGKGERTPDKIFSQGIPRSIAVRFGEGSKNGRFEFVAFCPIDPTGRWVPGTPEVENVIGALDFVMARHRIDPDRVYLTGLSNGGTGVWRFAEAYPGRWAAVAPLSSFYAPRVESVRHLPAWVFHGALDKSAPVEPQREFTAQLTKAGADARYTEFPHRGHTIFSEPYDGKELYDWFRVKTRRQQHP